MIEQLVPVGTATVRVASEPAEIGDVSETSRTLPDEEPRGGLEVRQRKP